MSTTPPRPDSGGTSDRVRCAYCGANNFPASATCWQCGRPLRPLSANASAPTGAPPPGPTPAGASPAPQWNAPGAVMGVSPGLAPKAAAALGLMLPWAGLPIGIAFLMLDDPRKVRLGWIAIGWSVAGTVLNLLLSLPLLLGLWSLVKSHAVGGGGIPGLPGVPGNGGGDMNSLCLRLPMF